VTLSGDKSGEYVVIEERPDGSLVLRPVASKRVSRPVESSPSPLGGLLSRLRTPEESPKTDEELLEGWGLQVRQDEHIREVFVADVDKRAGFLAITTERFVFAAHEARGRSGVEERRLSAVRSAEVVRRGFRHELRVIWEDAETVVGALDGEALSRLEGYLGSPRLA
jgi:hypothetical protein